MMILKIIAIALFNISILAIEINGEIFIQENNTYIIYNDKRKKKIRASLKDQKLKSFLKNKRLYVAAKGTFQENIFHIKKIKILNYDPLRHKKFELSK